MPETATVIVRKELEHAEAFRKHIKIIAEVILRHKVTRSVEGAEAELLGLVLFLALSNTSLVWQ